MYDNTAGCAFVADWKVFSIVSDIFEVWKLLGNKACIVFFWEKWRSVMHLVLWTWFFEPIVLFVLRHQQCEGRQWLRGISSAYMLQNCTEPIVFIVFKCCERKVSSRENNHKKWGVCRGATRTNTSTNVSFHINIPYSSWWRLPPISGGPLKKMANMPQKVKIESSQLWFCFPCINLHSETFSGISHNGSFLCSFSKGCSISVNNSLQVASWR